MQGKQNLILNNSKMCYSTGTSQLQRSNNFDLVHMTPTTASFNMKQSTVLDNIPSIGEGKDDSYHNSTLTNDSIPSRM